MTMVMELVAALWGLGVGYLVGHACAPARPRAGIRTIHVHQWRCGPAQQSETIHTDTGDYDLHLN